MVPFGGWDMPLSYPSGTLAEHRACRSDAVVFDVSHLGTVRIEGPDALERLQRAFTNDLNRVGPGQAQYTHLLDPQDASVVDDIIVWWIDDETFDVMPNASNTSGVTSALGAGAIDITEQRAILALQGPSARRLLHKIWPQAASIGRFKVMRARWNGVECTIAGTGYTGEDGLEIAVPADAAQDLWDAVIQAGFTPAGLGARDTLRLEAGLPLHGHELGSSITPLQAGLGWVVSWDKGDFIGREALAAERERGIARRLRALTVEGRRPPRSDQNVLLDGEVVGIVTSGNFSPILGQGIALAFVPPSVSIGDELQIEARGEAVAATVVRPPFVEASPTLPID